MATRNLTRNFKNLRKGFNDRRGPRGFGVGGGFDDGTTELMHTLPPHWVDSVEEVKALIKQIEGKVERLHGLHQSRLLVRFDQGSESSQEREIEAVTNQIRGLFKQGEAKLRRIANAGNVGGPVSAGDEKVRGNIQSQLAKQLQQLTMSLSKSQKEYKARVEAQKGGAGDLDGLLGPDPEAGLKTSFTVEGFTDEEVVMLELAETNVEERDQEIAKIAQSINELSTIFKELAVLVIDQGTILDRIDYNMENVVEQTQRGVKELQKAEKYSKSTRPLKCIAFLVILILLFTCILIAKHS